jgi:hypothetical protein
MNFKTTIFLIALLAIAGVTFFFVQRQPAPQAEQTTAKKLLTISQDDVTRVTLTPAGGQAISLEHVGSNWNITQPIQAKADTFTASDLVGELCGLQSHAQVGADVATGVDHPDYRVELTTKDEKTTTLAFGEKSGVGDNLYVRVDDRPKTDVVSGEIESYLDKPLSDYRDMNLVSASSEQIDRVRIERSGHAFSVVRHGNKWEINSPEHWQADPSQMEDYLSSLTSLRAAGFVEQPMSAAVYQFNKPQLVVAYWVAPAGNVTTKPTTQTVAKTIVFGGYENLLKQDVFAKADGTVARIAAVSMDNLNKTPLDLRDRTVLDIDPAKVEKIELQRDLPATTQPTKRAVSKVDLVILRNTKPPAATRPASTQATSRPTTKPSPKWVFANNKTATVDEANVNDLLDSLHPLTAEKYRAKLPTTPPADHFDLTITAGGKTYKIVFYATPANEQNGIAVYNGTVFEVPVTLIDHLKLDFGWPATGK